MKIDRPIILIYDSEDMVYLAGFNGNFDTYYIPDRCSVLHDGLVGVRSNTRFTCEIDDTKQLDNVKLDPTTMKRIAKFNKEQEIKRLDEEINKKKEKIKELDDILQDKDKRVKKLKEFVANIYNIDINDDDDEEDYDDFYY